MKLLRFLLLFVACAGVQMAQAQNATLFARFPLTAHGKEASNKILPLDLVGITFENGGAKCLGVYDDFEAGKGVAILSQAMSKLDLQNFSVRVDFYVSKQNTMPVFAIDRGWRHFAYYLTQDGKIELQANNGDFRKETATTYQINTWHTATLVHQKGTAIVYLDNKEVLRTAITLNKDAANEYNSKDISTVNFSNGQTFQGYWRNLRLYVGAWNPQTKEIIAPTEPDNNVTPTTTTALGTWKSTEFAINGTPLDSKTKWQLRRRQFFPLKNQAGNLEVIWQDQENKKIMLTRFDSNVQNPTHLALPAPANTQLLAATHDEVGNYYYAVFKTIEKSNENDIVTLCKADKAGKQLAQQAQNSNKNVLNIWKIGDYAGDLVCQKGQLAMFMARTMNKSGDGLNHQGGIATIFDANTLQITYHLGQTSGHSFDNYLTLTQNGEFVGIDLGDNYPRGIHLHKFTENKWNSKLVYTFKTEHGMDAKSPAGAVYPRYDEISKGDKTYYKWSNDNGTYSELGSVIEVNDGYLVVFSGEPDEAGKALNNAQAGYQTGVSRNLGFVKIRKDFENAQNLKEAVLSKGISETGGFYTFGGDWSKQANEGIVWLTKYKNAETENVKHIKTAQLPNGNILILYAVDELNSWQDKGTYQAYMMCIDAQGKITLPATAIGNDLRLSRRDDILLVGKRVVSIQADSAGKKISVYSLELK